MHFSRLPARAALAVVTAGALTLTVTGCGSSHSSSSKSHKSRSHSSGSSGSGASKSKDKKKKHRKRGVGTGGTAAKRMCRGSDLEVTVNKRSGAGDYLELVIEGSNRSCYLPRSYADVEFGKKEKVRASGTQSGSKANSRIGISPVNGVAYVGLRTNSTGEKGITYPGFDIGTGNGTARYVKVPGGVKVDRPLVTVFQREADEAVPGTEAR